VDGPRRELIGLGHDLQLIGDVDLASALREPDVFFTSGELRRFASATAPRQSLAGGFAAKEALFKALPAMDDTWLWTDAELIHDQHGAPQFRTHGALARQVATRRLRLSVSISHSGGFASCVVIVTGGTPPPTSLSGTINGAIRHVLRRIMAPASRATQ
jgi:holo-[acyl-carrier protein] synthase